MSAGMTMPSLRPPRPATCRQPPTPPALVVPCMAHAHAPHTGPPPPAAAAAPHLGQHPVQQQLAQLRELGVEHRHQGGVHGGERGRRHLALHQRAAEQATPAHQVLRKHLRRWVTAVRAVRRAAQGWAKGREGTTPHCASLTIALHQRTASTCTLHPAAPPPPPPPPPAHLWQDVLDVGGIDLVDEAVDRLAQRVPGHALVLHTAQHTQRTRSDQCKVQPCHVRPLNR